MAGIKSLVKDTAIYGMSSIVGRFLNWCLVPLYVYLFPAEEYGIVTNLYSLTAVALVVLTYGMETGFFRFANKEGADSDKVYSTSLISVGLTSVVFIILISIFLHPISRLIKLQQFPNFVLLMGITVAIDAFCNIPFAYLRFKNRPYRFATIKMVNVGLNIGLNTFFLLLCPKMVGHETSWLINWFYEPLGGASFGIGWIFVSNIISTGAVLLMLLPYFYNKMLVFEGELLSKILRYSWPLLVLGVAGILSQNMGQIAIPLLFPDNPQEAFTMNGIYGANMKIAIIMVMFTQAFRYAYEPFIFAQAKSRGENRDQMYCDAMKYFVIFGLFIFLAVMYFLPILKHFIDESYWSGLRVVPIMMIAELFAGVFFNLSLWYKLTDRTIWGMIFSLICFGVMLGLTIWLVPLIGIPDGYMGSAWAALIGYFVVMCLSYFIGRLYYPLDYPIRKMGMYTVLAALLYIAGNALEIEGWMWFTYISRGLLLCFFGLVIYLTEFRKGRLAVCS